MKQTKGTKKRINEHTTHKNGAKNGVSVKRRIGVYLFLKECCFRVRFRFRVRVTLKQLS